MLYSSASLSTGILASGTPNSWLKKVIQNKKNCWKKGKGLKHKLVLSKTHGFRIRHISQFLVPSQWIKSRWRRKTKRSSRRRCITSAITQIRRNAVKLIKTCFYYLIFWNNQESRIWSKTYRLLELPMAIPLGSDALLKFIESSPIESITSDARRGRSVWFFRLKSTVSLNRIN